MAFTDLIKPGDKIDIRLLQQVENEERTGDTVKVYKSQVLDINKRGNLEISMPTEGTKLILLPLDVRLEFVFIFLICTSMIWDVWSLQEVIPETCTRKLITSRSLPE